MRSEEVRGVHTGGTDRLIDINIRGNFVATQAALRHMKSDGPIIMRDSCDVADDVRKQNL